MTNTIKIEAGVDLDFAVAKACGMDDRKPEDFRPSTDLNSAFEAAEAVGLWRDYCYCQASSQDVICKSVPFDSWSDTIAHARTPCLAICEAILRLKNFL